MIYYLYMEDNTKHTQDLIEAFEETWSALDAYDKELYTQKEQGSAQFSFAEADFRKALEQFKQFLLDKGEATSMFAVEKTPGALSAIIENVAQSFGGVDVYKTPEEKAAHLLYFIIKNHPFTDGNKRTGAFACVYAIKHAGLLDTSHLTPTVLTLLAILVAQSRPEEKEKMINLVVSVISVQ